MAARVANAASAAEFEQLTSGVVRCRVRSAASCALTPG
jgi:hypothetical protein